MQRDSLTLSIKPATTDKAARRLRGGIKAGSLRRHSHPRLLFAGLGTALLGIVGLGIWWSAQPDKFDVLENASARVGGDPRALPAGATTVATAMQIGETLLDKNGGYPRNDKTPPGIWLDNMPNWEYGALTELRDSVRSFRNDFSRAQTQSLENEALKTADSKFNFDAKSWMLPAAEQEYRNGVEALGVFLAQIKDEGNTAARFHTRADNLAVYLAVVEKRLGSYGQRLVSSVGDEVLTKALAGSGIPVTASSAWHEVDDIFHEARGYTWALLHMMKALAVDFDDVLRQNNAEVSMQQVIRDLERATARKFSPIVLNGNGFGLLANHSLALAFYVARTNAAVLDLPQLLERG